MIAGNMSARSTQDGVSGKKPSPDDYEWLQVLGEGAFGDVRAHLILHFHF